MDYEAMTEPEIDALKAAARRSRRWRSLIISGIAGAAGGGAAFLLGASGWVPLGAAWLAGFVAALLFDLIDGRFG